MKFKVMGNGKMDMELENKVLNVARISCGVDIDGVEIRDGRIVYILSASLVPAMKFKRKFGDYFVIL